MRRILRTAFAIVLSLALAASGATLGIASHLSAQKDPAPLAHHAHDHGMLTDGEHGRHAHHHAVPHASDHAPQPASEHASKSCCTACTAASPLPPNPEPSRELIVSRAFYPKLTQLDVALTIAIDPGIPKRIG